MPNCRWLPLLLLLVALLLLLVLVLVLLLLLMLLLLLLLWLLLLWLLFGVPVILCRASVCQFADLCRETRLVGRQPNGQC